MNLSAKDCCVLNSGDGAWAFEPLAGQLLSSLSIEVAVEPRRFNYLLHVEEADSSTAGGLFIPIDAIRIASDKRLLAKTFQNHKVPTPETALIDTFAQAQQFIHNNPSSEWCLKYPTSCGANGHRMLNSKTVEPPNWPRPFVVQEFVHLERPEVFRTYCAGGELFGWVTRRFPKGVRPSPWVAHARGARYSVSGDPPVEVREIAQLALISTGLWMSFGCVDLLRKPSGEWVVLEVGTDGMFNHVDRDLGDPDFEQLLARRVADAFWKAADKYAMGG